jgi:hypothetical protein
MQSGTMIIALGTMKLLTQSNIYYFRFVSLIMYAAASTSPVRAMCVITKKERRIVLISVGVGTVIGLIAFAVMMLVMLRLLHCGFIYDGALQCPDSGGNKVVWLAASFISVIFAVFGTASVFIPLNACNDKDEDDEGIDGNGGKESGTVHGDIKPIR